MVWVRFDDQYPIHRKVSGLSDRAFRLHTTAVFWSSRNGTDGFIDADDLDDVCPKVRPAQRFAAECVQRRVWHPSGETCASAKCPAHVDNRPADSSGPVDNRPGWVIHDYLEYQPSARKVTEDRKAKAERQQRWLESKQRRGKDASQDGSEDSTPSPSPPRPEGSGAGNAPRHRANGRASPPGSPVLAMQKPPWCGTCDEDTRLTGDPPARCANCHPLVVLNPQENP
jgi:hypothetical protein